jgi:hypothetical protein
LAAFAGTQRDEAIVARVLRPIVLKQEEEVFLPNRLPERLRPKDGTAGDEWAWDEVSRKWALRTVLALRATVALTAYDIVANMVRTVAPSSGWWRKGEGMPFS